MIFSQFSFHKERVVLSLTRVFVFVCLHFCFSSSFQLFNRFTNFHKIWHERRAILGQPNLISFNFLQSVINRYGIASRYRDYATCGTIMFRSLEETRDFSFFQIIYFD